MAEAGFPTPGTTPPYRYANLVLQGGGMLGIAHVGAISALEEQGWRFVGVAGASAGAIVALLICAAREDLSKPVAERLKQVLETMPAADFVDGKPQVRRLIKRLLPQASLSIRDVALVPAWVSAIAQVRRRGGLNSGEAFMSWLGQELSERFAISTLADLRNKVERDLKGLRFGPVPWESALKVTSLALPFGLKLTLPRDLEFIAEDWDMAEAALIARASMGVPLFFEPLSLSLSRDSRWERLNDRLEHELGRRADEEVTELQLLDGGLLSNFPIDAFSSGSTAPAPDMEADTPASHLGDFPTIGIRLSAPGRIAAINGGLSGALAAVGLMFDAARAVRDREAALAHGAVRWPGTSSSARVRVVEIPIDDPDINWLDFGMPAVQQEALFEMGRRAVLG